jgi:hypothetical protein
MREKDKTLKIVPVILKPVTRSDLFSSLYKDQSIASIDPWLHCLNSIRDRVIMKTARESGNRNNTRIGRSIVLFLTSCFFLGVVALAMHHHDVFFQLNSCAICKAKASISNAVDLPTIMAMVNPSSGEIYFTVTRIHFRHQAPFISSLLPTPFLNKAPPFIS